MIARIVWTIVRLITAFSLSLGGLMITSVSFAAAAPSSQAQKGSGVGFSAPVAISSASTPAGATIQGAAAQGSNAATGLEILKDKRAHGIVVTDGKNPSFQVKWTVTSDDGDTFGPFVSTIPANTQYTRMDPRFDLVKIKDGSYGYIDAEIVGGAKFGRTKVLYQAGVNPQWVTPTPTTVNGSPCYFFDWWTVDITIVHSFSWTDQQGVSHTQDGETITIDSPNGSHVSGDTKAMPLPVTDSPATEITINTVSYKGTDPQARHVGSAGGFYNTCVTPPPPPQQDSAKCNSMTPNYVALKPGEQQTFKLAGSKVITYAIELDGTNVSNTDSFTFIAGSETFTHTLVGKVAGADGKVMSADSCVAQIVVSQNPPPPPTQLVPSCLYVDPSVAALKPGEQVEFTLAGENATKFQFEMGGQIVSRTNKFIFKASALGTFDIVGSVAGDDNQFVSAPDCAARVVVVNNPPPVGKSRMWTTSFPILSCDSLKQYNNDYVWVKGSMLVHINTENRDSNENWDIYNAQFSSNGDDPTAWIDAGATRRIGIESRTIPITQEVAIMWNARQNSMDAPATYGETHPFRDTLKGVNPLDYNQVRALGFHIPVPNTTDKFFGPARKGTKADAAYRWAYSVNVEACKARTTVTTPGDNTPKDITTEVCVGWKDGNPIINSFTLPKDQAAYDAAKANEYKACKPEAADTQAAVNNQRPVGKFVFGQNAVWVKPIGDHGQIAYQSAAIRNRKDKRVLSGHVHGVFADLHNVAVGSHLTYYVLNTKGQVIGTEEYIVRRSEGIDAHSDAYLHPENVQGDMLDFTCYDPTQNPDGSWTTQTTWMLVADRIG